MGDDQSDRLRCAGLLLKLPVSLQLAIATALWGGTFTAGRIAVQQLSPLAVACGRYLLATTVLLLIMLQRERWPRLDHRQQGLLFGLGVSGIALYNWLFFIGLSLIPASRAALIIALNPTAIALGAALWTGDRLRSWQWAGVGLSLIGAVLLLGSRQAGTLTLPGWGDLALIGCVLCWTVYSLLARQALRSLSPLTVTTGACCWGSLLLVGLWAWQGVLLPTDLSLTTTAAIAYLGLGGTALAFCLYANGIERLGAARAGLFINLVPVFGSAIGALLLQEPLSVLTLVGGLLVLAGVGLGTIQPSGLSLAAVDPSQPSPVAQRDR
ncbi:DMT family transporter [Synechococcus elongatus]|uniref:DMT family transporter n=1 Tax=Synechococcus elongatus TaxID=32046 RepID=UPI001E639717|nr:DMT family transporter [Synechococcus elongatus]